MTLYHGTGCPFTANPNMALYATPNIDEAREYALGLTDDGDYNRHSYIYAIEVEGDVVEIDDFMEFDSLGYDDYESMPEIAHNSESGYFCIKHPVNVRLIEEKENEL